MDNNDIFSKRLNQLGIKKQVDASMIVANAQRVIVEAFGQRGADNIRVVSYSKGVLKISSTNGAWAAECQGMLPKLKTPPVERVVFISAYFDRDK